MRDRIHVCILSSAHPIDDVRVNRKLVRSLIETGFRVTWVGPGHHDFPSCGGVSEGSLWEFRLFPRPVGRIARLLSRRLIREAACVRAVDVYLGVEPDSAYVAARLARRSGAKAVFDIHELYHEAHVDNWVPFGGRLAARHLVQRMIGMVCRRCDLVFGASEGVLKPYRRESKESLVIRNCAPRDYSPAPSTEGYVGEDGVFRIMHGKTSTYSGTPVVLKALASLGVEARGIQTVMFEWFGRTGDMGRRELLDTIKALGLERVVDLRTAVQPQEVPEILQRCHVGMISHGRMLKAGTHPNRAYEYMAAGLPIIAPLYDEGLAPVIRAEGCGLLIDSERPEEIARAVKYLKESPVLARDLGARGRRAFLARHNWEVEVAPLLERIRSWFPGRTT